MKRTAKLWLIGLLLVIIAASMALLYIKTRPQAETGAKTITVQVTHADGTQRSISLETDEAWLWDAMYAEGLIDGRDDAYGKWIEQVDGETADEAARQCWVFTRSGQWVETSCDTTPISDGEQYEFSIYSW